jgi:hypothetical protein
LSFFNGKLISHLNDLKIKSHEDTLPEEGFKAFMALRFNYLLIAFPGVSYPRLIFFIYGR